MLTPLLDGDDGSATLSRNEEFRTAVVRNQPRKMLINSRA
jgi:hypothetical protein